jgi:hypothetical protein
VTQFHTVVYSDHPTETTAAEILADVVSGYVSLESAERDYGVVIRYLGTPEQWVRLSEHYAVDAEATARLRASRAVMEWNEHGSLETSSRETEQLL